MKYAPLLNKYMFYTTQSLSLTDIRFFSIDKNLNSTFSKYGLLGGGESPRGCTNFFFGMLR